MSEVFERLYARMSDKELRVQISNDNAIIKAGGLQQAYGSNPSRVVPGRGDWAGKWWCLKGLISDGPFNTYIDAINCGRQLDGLPEFSGFPKTSTPHQKGN